MPETTLDLDIRANRGSFALDAAGSVKIDGVTALFGPSGSGKTTLLRAIAGLGRPPEGRIAFGGTVWLDSDQRRMVPAHKRRVGLVFQDARLFPHLDVAGNLDYAARRARATSDWRETVIEALDLKPLLARPTEDLSGGEGQRVALGRSLMSRPRLLLLDEPLAGLDTRRKSSILPYLARLPNEFRIPILYVSHAVDEVMQLSSRLVTIRDGRLGASGPTLEMLDRPDMQALTGRFEAGTAVTARVLAHDADLCLTRLEVEGQSLDMPILRDLAVGADIRLRIRARDVSLATRRPEGLSIRNCLKGTLTRLAIEPDTAFAEATVSMGDAAIIARLTRASVRDLGLVEGQPIFALVKSVAFDRRGLARGATG